MNKTHIDIGINLLNKQFKNDINGAIKRALDTNVSQMIMTGTSLKNSIESLNIAKQHTNKIFATAGIHPHNAKEFNKDTKQNLGKLLSDAQTVAVGECGLDFDRDFSPRPIQESCFKMHLELAIETQKPLFLHEREAFTRFNAIITDYIKDLPKTVVHCFTGTKNVVKTYLDQGFYIGFTGAISDSRRFDHLKEVVDYVPLDRLMIETDSPFMLPKNLPQHLIKPQHKRRNEPAFLPYVAETVAKFKNISPEEVMAQTTQNAKLFFGI